MRKALAIQPWVETVPLLDFQLLYSPVSLRGANGDDDKNDDQYSASRPAIDAVSWGAEKPIPYKAVRSNISRISSWSDPSGLILITLGGNTIEIHCLLKTVKSSKATFELNSSRSMVFSLLAMIIN